MDKIKSWFLEVGLKQFGPSALRGAILGLGAFLAARQEVLSALGIVYDASTHIITVNLDKLNLGLVALLPAVGAGVIKILNYHGTQAVQAVLPKPNEETQTPPSTGA